jgi:hypothetical protein
VVSDAHHALSALLPVPHDRVHCLLVVAEDFHSVPEAPGNGRDFKVVGIGAPFFHLLEVVRPGLVVSILGEDFRHDLGAATRRTTSASSLLDHDEALEVVGVLLHELNCKLGQHCFQGLRGGGLTSLGTDDGMALVSPVHLHGSRVEEAVS